MLVVNVTLNIEPVNDILCDSERPTNVSKISLILGEFNNYLFQFQNIREWFQLCLSALDVFENLIVSLDSAQITYGYSEVFCSSLFLIKKDYLPKKIKTPCARI